jgi:hypothetical protein
MAASAHDLIDLLETSTCECFNMADDHPLRNALAAECRDDASMLLQSDVDEGVCARLAVCRQPALSPHAPCAQSSWSS